ncbi:MAG: sigma-70 family RNA polymerase sigma factor [Clostridiales bacterium]|nr:sigma-70 family RNA polymerase sigma factor [Clostridiales bacterium]
MIETLNRKVIKLEKNREKIEQPKQLTLDERVERAKHSELERDKLISEYVPFLRAMVAKHSPRHYDVHLREDLFSAALLGFDEALQNYDIGKGRFLTFATRVVSFRIIDQTRKIKRTEGKTISLNDTDQETASSSLVEINKVSQSNYEALTRREALEEEIEQFKEELLQWQSTMEDLVKASPKHQKLREICKEITSAVMQNPEIIQTMQQKKYYPVKKIEILTGLPRKTIERTRMFIIASIIIKTGDYRFLQDYVGEEGRI